MSVKLGPYTKSRTYKRMLRRKFVQNLEEKQEDGRKLHCEEVYNL
jgi:hypothetical protein